MILETCSPVPDLWDLMAREYPTDAGNVAPMRWEGYVSAQLAIALLVYQCNSAHAPNTVAARIAASTWSSQDQVAIKPGLLPRREVRWGTFPARTTKPSAQVSQTMRVQNGWYGK